MRNCHRQSPKCKPPRKYFRLKPGLAVERDDSPFGNRAFQRPKLFHDPDPVIGDIAQTGQLIGGNQQEDGPESQSKPPGRSATAARGGNPGEITFGNQ